MRTVLNLVAAAICAPILLELPTVPALLTVLTVAAARWWVGDMVGELVS